MPHTGQLYYAYMDNLAPLQSGAAGPLDTSSSAPLLPGCPHAREAVVGHYLAFMHKHLLEHLYKTYSDTTVSRTSICYCIAIPQSWGRSGKQLARR